MDFNHSLPLKDQLKDFAQHSDKNGDFMASVYFFGRDWNWKKPNKNDKRKIDWYKMRELCCQSANQGQTEALETIYKSAKHIMEDDSISKEEKFNMLFGDVELLLQASVLHFKNKWDNNGTMGPVDFDSMRRRYEIDSEKL